MYFETIHCIQHIAHWTMCMMEGVLCRQFRGFGACILSARTDIFAQGVGRLNRFTGNDRSFYIIFFSFLRLNSFVIYKAFSFLPFPTVKLINIDLGRLLRIGHFASCWFYFEYEGCLKRIACSYPGINIKFTESMIIYKNSFIIIGFSSMI